MERMPDVVLTGEEVGMLKKICREKNTSWTVRSRSRVLLALAQGFSYDQCMRKAGVSKPTVAKVKRLMMEGGVDAVIHLRRNPNSDNARRRVDAQLEAAILAFACQSPPPGYSHWTPRLLANAIFPIYLTLLSPQTIARVLHKKGIHPERTRYWCLAPYLDSEEKKAAFVRAMEDVLEVYSRPLDPDVVVVCMDEKPIQLLGESRAPLPAKEGRPQTVDCEYVRNGTASIFLSIQPLTGWIHVSARNHRTAIDWAEEVKDLVDVRFPHAKKLILVMDNLNTHTVKSLYKAFPPEEARRIEQKIEIHFTPKHASWLDIAEIGLNIMTRQCLRRRIGDLKTLGEELAAWEQARNANLRPINWRFTTADARIKLAGLYPPGLLEELERGRDKPAVTVAAC